MKILLIGKTGQLGSDLRKAGTRHEIIAPDRSELDLTDAGGIRQILEKVGPEVVINTAAFHDVWACEKDYAEAFKVNCIAVRDLGRACARNGALFVTFSSDYVFDGAQGTAYTEDDAVSPLQVYGASRAAGEALALSAAAGNALVIRTCGLYGAAGSRSRGGNFVDKRVQDADKTDAVEMSCEQTGSPTYTVDLARAVLDLIDAPGRGQGIYHLVNEGSCAWSDFTAAIYQGMGLATKVVPVDRQGLDRGMRRPLFPVLSNTRARRLGITLPPWQDALPRYLQEKYGKQGKR